MRGLIVNAIISALAFVAGFWIFQSISPESEPPRANHEQARVSDRRDSRESPPAPDVIHFSNYNVIGQKNLFRPERREWVPPANAESPSQEKRPEQTGPPAPRPRLTLYGTIIYGDDVKIAIIKGAGSRGTPEEEKRNYRLGDEISGYQIQKIEEERVVLAKGEDVIELKLREGKSRPAAPPVRPLPRQQAGRTVSTPGRVQPSVPAGVSGGGEPERIVVKGPGGREIVKRKKVIRTPFGPKTIYIEEK